MTHAWTGQVDITRDRLPHIRHDRGLVSVSGLGGHGLALGAYLGRAAALALSGGRLDLPFAAIPHPAFPGCGSPAWILPIATAYYRVKDALV